MRSVCIPDVVTIIYLRVPYQGGWTVFQVRDVVVAEPELEHRQWNYWNTGNGFTNKVNIAPRALRGSSDSILILNTGNGIACIAICKVWFISINIYHYKQSWYCTKYQIAFDIFFRIQGNFYEYEAHLLRLIAHFRVMWIGLRIHKSIPIEYLG